MTTLVRMCENEELIRIGRGLYQLSSAECEFHHSFAAVSKRVPGCVVCLVSALAYHDLTDQLPRKTWTAIGNRRWTPQAKDLPVRVVKFTDAFLEDGVETTVIEGVSVKVFGVAKTIADCFRHRRVVGLAVVLEGLQEAIRSKKVTPAEIFTAAKRGGVATVVRPYLEALTANS